MMRTECFYERHFRKMKDRLHISMFRSVGLAARQYMPARRSSTGRIFRELESDLPDGHYVLVGHRNYTLEIYDANGVCAIRWRRDDGKVLFH